MTPLSLVDFIMKLTINTDGGSRGNPGLAAYAFVVKENGEVIYEQKETIGVATNNKAEVDYHK